MKKLKEYEEKEKWENTKAVVKTLNILFGTSPVKRKAVRFSGCRSPERGGWSGRMKGSSVQHHQYQMWRGSRTLTDGPELWVVTADTRGWKYFVLASFALLNLIQQICWQKWSFLFWLRQFLSDIYSYRCHKNNLLLRFLSSEWLPEKELQG